MKINKLILAGLCTATMGLSSCASDFLDTDITEGVDKETATDLAKKDPSALNGYLNGAYAFMVKSDINGSSSHDDFSFMSVLHATDMMTEDMVQSSSHWFNYDYALDNRMYNYRRTSVNWKTFYTIIAKANEMIDFFPEEPTSAESKGILGQAYALRGMSYTYLIQLYQRGYTGNASQLQLPGVPLRYASVEGLSEEEAKAKTGRNTVKVIYKQIELDLLKAVELLGAGYERPTKIYIDASVAHGLLARYYLLTHDWGKAASEAKIAATDYTVMSTSSLHDGFMDITNNEWMWGFDHSTETQTTFASLFSHLSNLTPGYAGLGYAPRLIDAKLYSQISDTDERKKLFNDPKKTLNPSKLPLANLKFGWDGNWTMDYVYMRAAEMKLIEAEALAQQNKSGEAATVLKELMTNRDPEWNKTSVTVEDVYLQRRIELWGEGFNFFDLKRLDKGVVRVYEGSNHREDSKLNVPAGDVRWTYQIPNAEIQENDQISLDDKND